MSTITATEIGVNVNAPVDSAAINLYDTHGASGLTLSQLVQSVCIYVAGALERESVLKMNTMTSGSRLLDEAASWLSQIVDEDSGCDWSEAKSFLVDKMGIDESSLPSDLSSYDKRMQAAEALMDKMDNLTTSQQQDMVDLQTLVNRRDTAYSTSSNATRAFASSVTGVARNFSS